MVLGHVLALGQQLVVVVVVVVVVVWEVELEQGMAGDSL